MSASPNKLPRLGSRVEERNRVSLPNEKPITHTFTDSELLLLADVSSRNDVPVDGVLRALELEASFHRMGRRRGLFPALRELVVELAGSSNEAVSEPGEAR